MLIPQIFRLFSKKIDNISIYCSYLRKKILTAEFFCIILHSETGLLHHLKKCGISESCAWMLMNSRLDELIEEKAVVLKHDWRDGREPKIALS